MAAGVPFCTLAEAKTYLGIKYETEDASLERLIDAASAAIRSYCNREILEAPYSRKFIGNGKSEAFIPGDPIVSVTWVTVDGTALDAGDPGFISIKNTVYLRGYVFTRGAVCEIGYTAGHAAVPNDVKQAALRILGSWQSKRGHLDYESKTANGETTAYETGAMPNDVPILLKQFVQYTPGA